MYDFYFIINQIGFSDLNDAISQLEALVKSSVIKSISQIKFDLDYFAFNYRKELKSELNENFSLYNRYSCISYDKAIELLKSDAKKSSNFKRKIAWGVQLSLEHYLYLINTFFNKTPIFIFNYPSHLLSEFYKSSSDKYKSFATLVFPIVGEVGYCFTIENDFTKYTSDHSLSGDDLNRLLEDSCQFGSCGMSGFSLKFDSLIKYICCCNSIAESIPYPRSRNLIDC